MSRPILIFLLVLAALVLVLIGLASLDRPVATTHVDQPVGNAAAH